MTWFFVLIVLLTRFASVRIAMGQETASQTAEQVQFFEAKSCR